MTSALAVASVPGDPSSLVPGLALTIVVLIGLGLAGRIRVGREVPRLGIEHGSSMPTWRRATLRIWRRSRPTTPTPRAVADWCDDVARTLRSGESVRHAVAHTVPGDERLEVLTDDLRRAAQRGEPLDEAARRCASPGPHLQLALVVIATVADLGGAAAMALDRTAGALRQRAADADDRAVHAAQARMSAHVLTALPLAMLAVLGAVDADVRAVVTTPAGSASIAAGLALNALGWWSISRLTRVSV